MCLLFVQFSCSERAFKSFDGSPVNKQKLKKKVFRLLSNSSFIGTFTDHIICFQIFFATNGTLTLITKNKLIVTKLKFHYNMS